MKEILIESSNPQPEVRKNAETAKLIPLTGVRGKGKHAIVDSEDYPYFSKHKWYCIWSGYPSTTTWERKTNVHHVMHRMIMKAKKGQFVDHINRNKLDNRKSNLRFCNIKQSARNIGPRNKWGYKGVSLIKKTKMWRAAIKVNYKNIHLGHYQNVIEAAKAYNRAAKTYFGEFAYLNPV